ncbi:hypothetical protein V9T40_011631 [Parthenolecanium corni]|uniref:Nucleoporin Nup54 alpha-helical domain-containing protein n=1 Tax=Parthenolecanium corni TaxID=536013 RepID=A0AAN9T6E2_9HEMI
MSFNFGAPAFGATASTAAPTFSFGSPSNTQAKGFGQTGFSFGGSSAPATTTSGFGFGGLTSTTPSKGFGTATNTGFGTGTNTGFGAAVAPSTGFGTAAGTNTGFGLGTGTNTGFGTGTTTSTGFGAGFGSTFGPTSNPAPSFNFNPPATTTQSLFSGFGQTQTNPSGGFAGFGNKQFGSGAPPTFNSPWNNTLGQGFGVNAQQQQTGPTNPNEAILTSVYKCNIFGDERDQILGNWNLLQAFWGTGKGYYAQNATPFEYNPQNILCGLKTVGYSVKPKIASSDGLVVISINKKPDDIRNQQIQFESSVSAILGNKPNVTVHVDRVSAAPDSKSLVLIYVAERMPNGIFRRVQNTDISSYLLQPMQKQQLGSLGIDNVYPFTSPSESQLNEYLENTPAGIDSRLWKQAQLDNPDKEKFIPVPIIGFNGILWRSKCQEEQVKLHEALLDGISEDISSMQRVQVATNVKLGELKQKTLELEHRVLKLIVKVSRTGADGGLPFGPEEERMKSRLESLEASFNKPSGIKDRLSQIITSLRMHDVSNEKRYECDVDDTMLNDLKEFLGLQQKAIRELKDVLQSDLADMKLMEEELRRFQAVQAS